MTPPSPVRRILLWAAVVAFIIVPATTGGVECERAASAVADASARSPHGCGLPREVVFACALIGPGAVSAGTRGLALGALLTAPLLAGAILLELRERRRSDPKARPLTAPMVVLLAGIANTVVAAGLGYAYHSYAEHDREKARICREYGPIAKRAWLEYHPKDNAARIAVGKVRHAAGYYSVDTVCELARAVPPDTADPAYAKAMEATERLWELCRTRSGAPFCTRAPLTASAPPRLAP